MMSNYEEDERTIGDEWCGSLGSHGSVGLQAGSTARGVYWGANLEGKDIAGSHLDTKKKKDTKIIGIQIL